MGGPLGNHRFEGYWKNPEGKVNVISDFSYEATHTRFGGYWTLILGDTMTTGIWTLEARVDGEVTGAHNFQILAAPRPPGAELPSVRPHLAAAEIYRRGVAACVTVEALDAAGEKFADGAGFFLGDDIVVTAFQVVDGAHRLRMVLSDGRRVESDQLLGWNRWQDWAIVQVDASPTPKLSRAESKPVVGERVYTLDTPSAGSRTILDLDVIGVNSYDRAGERLNVTSPVAPSGSGAPVLNVYGDVVGVMGGSVLPGSGALSFTRFSYINLNLLTSIRGGLAVPISLVSLRGSKPTALTQLHATGQMIPPVKAVQEVMTGNFSRAVKSSSGFPQMIDNKNEFSVKDKECAVSVMVRGTTKAKSVVNIRVFDADNRQLAEGKPMKTNFRVGEVKSFDWKLPIDKLRPGYHRVDVLVDTTPVWRGFLQIVE